METTEVKNTPVTYGPDDVDKNIDIEYAAKVCSEVVNINAINSYIETLVNSRAMRDVYKRQVIYRFLLPIGGHITS